jgi:hypothetical protein
MPRRSSPRVQGALGGLGWNLWGTPVKDMKDSTPAAGKENQGVAGLRAASSEIPFSPTKVSERQWLVNTSGTSQGPQAPGGTNTYTYTCIHTHIQIYIHLYVHTYIHSHTNIHTYTHTHIHTGSSATAKTVGRRISSDMQLRLERYQQAVAQSSPTAQVSGKTNYQNYWPLPSHHQLQR